ncbi:MAG: hypothetical protein IJ060_08405 [Oscillospiraceae bacterium]|nr:hypothetical protein [Oscillospiraceae bacterium]
MLSKPGAGWSDLTLGDFRAGISFLTDIPFDWLRACINGLKYVIPAAFYFDEEGSTGLIVSDLGVTYIIIQHNGTELTTVQGVGLKQFAEMLVHDIRENLEDWVCWCTFELSDEQYARREAMLRELLAETETCLAGFLKGNIENY